MSDYARHIVIDLPYERTLVIVREVIAREGLVASPSVDLRAVVHEALGEELRRYAVLMAVEPSSTLQALRLDLDIGAALPAIVAVYELGDGQTVVAIGHRFEEIASNQSWRTDRPDLAGLADALEERFGRLLSSIAHDATTIRV